MSSKKLCMTKPSNSLALARVRQIIFNLFTQFGSRVKNLYLFTRLEHLSYFLTVIGKQEATSRKSLEYTQIHTRLSAVEIRASNIQDDMRTLKQGEQLLSPYGSVINS